MKRDRIKSHHDEIVTMIDRGTPLYTIADTLGMKYDSLRAYLYRIRKKVPKEVELKHNDIIRLIQEGKTFDEVSKETGISVYRIKKHLYPLGWKKIYYRKIFDIASELLYRNCTTKMTAQITGLKLTQCIHILTKLPRSKYKRIYSIENVHKLIVTHNLRIMGYKWTEIAKVLDCDAYCLMKLYRKHDINNIVQISAINESLK